MSYAFGFDMALAASGMACVAYGPLGWKLEASKLVTTPPHLHISERCRMIMRHVRQFVRDHSDTSVPIFGVESFARNTRFRREEAGAAAASLYCALDRWLREGEAEFVEVTPHDAKVRVCPNWPGNNMETWVAAGRDPKKYQFSMPDKDAVMNGLCARYGVALTNEHKADAACVAIEAIHRRDPALKDQSLRRAKRVRKK